jgi:hypothetical protein
MRQLLERESSLASLAAYAQEARRGHGRLVLVAGEAGVGKSALVEQFSVTCQMRAGPGGRATAFSPRGRSGRCLTSLSGSAVSCWTCAAPALLAKSCSGPCCARSANGERWT